MSERDVVDVLNDALCDTIHGTDYDLVPVETCQEAAAEITQLRAVVERLPLTADGVRVVPGDTVFVDGLLGEVAASKYSNGIEARVYRENWKQGNGDWSWHDLSECYSTREAAEAAREGE